ncbi:uncharacterized protein LOC127284487 isoform X2 [Leptopilina boulardi]|uniref:uncharacterized protein LOC127284487 isoform X2 n=1 Tax=Leptopilina boulardi TaxID=63433 RepID=UPI0021F5CD22|nr:uncharacterized protein LOC127284487 isoform X2 [Leptopilina boulardi]
MSSEVQVTLVLLVAVLTTLSSGFPQKITNADKTSQESSGGPPFLEFKNGAVRLNFGGYHAEAGLGGLLGGGRAGGGLHVSAGTPDGSHASAGLGGLLGDNGSAGGGLHARAGLGNGGPEAKAGLGGVLDGTKKKYGEGSLFADSTWKKGEKNENERKNIQVIPRASKSKEVASSASSSSSKDITANVDSGASATSSDAATVTSLKEEKDDEDKDTGIGISVLKIKTLDKSEPIEFATSTDTIDSNLESRNRGIYPARWYRKRFRTGPEVSYSHNDGQKASTLFDDIFNIPISTLNAVNQLLKNKIG